MTRDTKTLNDAVDDAGVHDAPAEFGMNAAYATHTSQWQYLMSL